MCCFLLALFGGGPRLGILVMWLFPQGRLLMNLAYNTFIWPLLGFIFLPWTTLIYAIVYGINGITGFDWVWLGIAVLLDIATWTGGGMRRRSVPGYPASAP
jgi:hypothetical protein